jgi:putative ATP-dependent endonuclease of OLD family
VLHGTPCWVPWVTFGCRRLRCAMRIRQVRISAFRGWQELELRPGRHALVVGEPRAGRSDLIEALRRVLGPDSTRTPPDEFDVYLPIQTGTDGEVCTDGGGTGGGDVPDARDDATEAAPDIRRAEVEVVLADLGEALEQHFFRRLELWDRDDDALVIESTAEQLDKDRHELVLRLCYRLRWNPEERVGEHWVDYPKTSDPDDESYDRVRRPDRLVLPFVCLEPVSRLRCDRVVPSVSYSPPVATIWPPRWRSYLWPLTALLTVSARPKSSAPY